MLERIRQHLVALIASIAKDCDLCKEAQALLAEVEAEIKAQAPKQ